MDLGSGISIKVEEKREIIEWQGSEVGEVIKEKYCEWQGVLCKGDITFNCVYIEMKQFI